MMLRVIPRTFTIWGQNKIPPHKLFCGVRVFSNKTFVHSKTTSKKSLPKTPVIEVWDGITVKELASLSRKQPSQILACLNSGLLTSHSASMNTRIEDRKLLTSLLNLMGLRPTFQTHSGKPIEDKDAHPRPPSSPSDCFPRPPIVTILGHVDHGKTTLLDALRSTRVVDAEYGGITQHLSAFTISLASVAASAGMTATSLSLSDLSAEKITFLDTPGHAAFSTIRARGASVTDMVVLVVAADDGVMPQTVESIRFAKEADTPIVVAINKVDKPGVDVRRVLDELADHGVVTEQLNGEVQAVEISALKQQNLHGLMEAICLQAELMQLRSDPTGPVEGVVLEANVEHGLGKITVCLITRGQLKKTPASGPLTAGEAICSPRIIMNDQGQRVQSIGPGHVAKIAGWKELPPAGSLLLEVEDTSRASEVIRYRRNMRMQQQAVADHDAYKTRMEPYQKQYDAFLLERSKSSPSMWQRLTKRRPKWLEPTGEEQIVLPLFIKADVHGSLEAIRTLLASCPTDECSIEFGQSSVGPLTETEVGMAEAVGATILLFNVSALSGAEELAEQKGILIKQYNIIYRLAEDVRDMINLRLPALIEEQVIGEAEILQLFVVKESRDGGKPTRIPVAGCRCTKGILLADNSSSKIATDLVKSGELISTHYRIIRPQTAQPPGMNPSTTTDDAIDAFSPGSVLVSQATCRSLRNERTVVESIKKGVECGLCLTSTEVVAPAESKRSNSTPNGSDHFVSNWKPGDLVQCYVLVRKPRSVQWDFDTKSEE